MAEKSVKGYRAGESLPHTFNAAEILDLINARTHAKSLGLPVESALDIGKRILVEGRSDAGTNSYDWNNKAASAAHKAMRLGGHGDTAATFVAAQVEKSAVASRLGISFDEAWNGTGRSHVGKTGKDYEKRSQEFEKVKTDPRNKEFFDLIANAEIAPYKANEAFLLDPYRLKVMAYGEHLTDRSGDNLPFVKAFDKIAAKYPGQKLGYLAASTASDEAAIVATRELRGGNIASMHSYDKERLAIFDSKPADYRKMVEEFAQPMIDVKSPPKPIEKLPDPTPPEQSISDRIKSTVSSIFSYSPDK